MTSCRCGNIAVYRVIKRGITIPSICQEFCNVCLKKDSWYAIHYHDYKIEQIQYDTKTCTYNVVHTPSNTIQQRNGPILFLEDVEGIGEKRAARLREEGITTIEQLSTIRLGDICRITKCNEKDAETIRAGAEWWMNYLYK